MFLNSEGFAQKFLVTTIGLGVLYINQQHLNSFFKIFLEFSILPAIFFAFLLGWIVGLEIIRQLVCLIFLRKLALSLTGLEKFIVETVNKYPYTTLILLGYSSLCFGSTYETDFLQMLFKGGFRFGVIFAYITLILFSFLSSLSVSR